MSTVSKAIRMASKIEWDLNVYCPEQWYGQDSFWDTDLWKINARVYSVGGAEANRDTEYTITLLEKEARAIGLVPFGEKAKLDHDYILDDWLDAGLDGTIDLNSFRQLYWEDCSDRIKEFLDELPVYLQDVPDRMIW